LTTASGVKIGKTEGASGSEMVWLDPEMTSPYRMYQYWINTDDRDVVKFLKLFTFLEMSPIAEMEESLKQDPGKREPHRRLAFEFTRLAHGEEAGRAAQEASEVLFGSEVQTLSREVFAALAGEVPATKISKGRIQNGVPLADLLLETNLVKSKRAARDLIGQGGAYVNNKAWKDLEAKVGVDQALSGRGVLLRAGKKNYHLLIIQ
jgi:tyrosyl-tRNA synthetase